MKVEEYYLRILIRKSQLKMGGKRDEISKMIKIKYCCIGNRRLADTSKTDRLERRLNKEAGNYEHCKRISTKETSKIKVQIVLNTKRKILSKRTKETRYEEKETISYYNTHNNFNVKQHDREEIKPISLIHRSEWA